MYISLEELLAKYGRCELKQSVTSTVSASDEMYYVPTQAELEELLLVYANRVAELGLLYVPDKGDCDTYAWLLKAMASLQAWQDGVLRAPYPMAFVIGYLPNHAMNLCLVRDEAGLDTHFVLIEPQDISQYTGDEMEYQLTAIGLTVF